MVALKWLDKNFEICCMSVLLAIMTVLSFTNVVMRYCFNNALSWSDEVGFTVKEVVETAREVTGHPIPAKEEARRAGDPSTLIASSGRAKGILGWKPQYADLRVIIETAWKWHQAHPHGYKAD